MTNLQQAATYLSQCRVLDGGFATELEGLGMTLGGPLWSARALDDAPEAILAVHRSYLAAGADTLLTASYQVSTRGFISAGLSAEHAANAATRALRRSVALAMQAAGDAGKPDTLIAASLGPYGGALANGAEFHGNYGFADEEEQHAALIRFHRERIAVLAGTDADLLAFETVPSLAEARAIVEALAACPGAGAWMSFTCRDAVHTAHGERLQDCAAMLDAAPQVLAIGINCTAPALILPLLRAMRPATAKPLLVYPNSGEAWDAGQRCWTGSADAAAYGKLAGKWFSAGSAIVGGCCRTTPEHVRAVREAADRL